MKSIALKNLVLLGGVLLITACKSYEFEALTRQSVAPPPATDSETDDNTSPEVLKHQLLPMHDMFDDDAPPLASYRKLTQVVVGDGTPASCTDDSLRRAVSEVNGRGEGRIVFDCGDAFHRIELYNPLKIDSGVQLMMSGALMNDARKPTVALDGRQEKQILLLSDNNRIALTRLVFLNGKSDVERHGGAITFSSSEADGELIVSECVFKNNNASGNHGGAIYVGNLARFTVYRSVFEGNHAVSGGALFMYECQFDIVDSLFLENKAGNDGGAVFMNNKSTEAVSAYLFKGNEFTINRADGDGSAVVIQQGEHIETRVTQCQFFRNIKQTDQSGGVGGALCVFGGMLRLQSASFLENKSEYATAGLYINSDNGVIAENCTFYGNLAAQAKSGAFHQVDETASTIRNCTFLRNQGGEVGAIYREETQNLTIVSSLFAYNTVDPYVSRSCSGTFVDSSTGSNLQYEEYPGTDSKNCTAGVNMSEPRIHNPKENGGFVFTCAIESNSPARDIGEDCADFDARGFTRAEAMQSCDAGAFEYGESDAQQTDTSIASQLGL